MTNQTKTTDKLKIRKPKNVLGLRTCKADMTSYGGFKWKKKGVVACSDFDPAPRCGGGLHFLLWGEGNGELLDWNDDAVWQVVMAKEKEIVAIDGGEKYKAPSVVVVHTGNRESATHYILEHGGVGKAITGLTISAADKATISVGHRGQASAGNGGQASAGYKGQASAGNGGQASAGEYGQASAGYKGQASAGEKGLIVIQYWDADEGRPRVKVGYVGEDGLKPDVTYKLNEKLEFVETEARVWVKP